MHNRHEVTFTVRVLFNLIRRNLDPEGEMKCGLSPMQGRAIGFIAHHGEQDVFQRDIEREFQIRRSTATNLLQTMERDGLLTRQAVAYDARLKKLVLTDKALELGKHGDEKLRRVESMVTHGVSREELDSFFAVAEKFAHNLKNAGLAEAPDACCNQEEEKE